MGEPRIEGMPSKAVMADTACDSHSLRQKIAENGAVAVIPENAASECSIHSD